MHLQRPTHDDFDKWLTELPDEELQYLSNVTDQVPDDKVQDQAALTHILSLILHFCGKHALSIEEITTMFPGFTVCLALEILRRRGGVIKDGKYSIVPGEDGAQFMMTDKGKAEGTEQ